MYKLYLRISQAVVTVRYELGWCFEKSSTR